MPPVGALGTENKICYERINWVVSKKEKKERKKEEEMNE